MSKVLASILVILSFVLGVGVSYIYMQKEVNEAFEFGGISESAAMAELLAKTTSETDDPQKLASKILKISCISASSVIGYIKINGKAQEGSYISQDRADTARAIGNQHGIEQCAQ